ncbi:hypothetical protein C3E99_08925 [Sphingopyxis sp. MG]|nr:hypothetical protein C3E99_08925 [Sphingopyxis sp. MG]
MGIHLATVLYRVSPRRRGPICGGFEMEPAEDGPPPSRGNTALYNIAAIDSESPQTLGRIDIQLWRPANSGFASFRCSRAISTLRSGSRKSTILTCGRLRLRLAIL